MKTCIYKGFVTHRRFKPLRHYFSYKTFSILFDLTELEEIHKKIKQRIASRILSTNKEKWWTISAFYSECDEIRENEDKMFSFKTVDEKLKFLDGINDYVMNLEQKYSDA